MILNNVYRRRLEQRRRAGFTLLEVLVVVAILVVLASVSSIYVFRYLEDAKIDKAKLQAANIAKAAKSYIIKNDGSTDGLSLQVLVAPPRPFLEGGNESIVTPFGTPFNLEIGNDGGAANIVVTFQAPDGHTYDDRGRKRQ
jgi:general secretion pathway protein G